MDIRIAQVEDRQSTKSSELNLIGVWSAGGPDTIPTTQDSSTGSYCVLTVGKDFVRTRTGSSLGLL